MDYSGFVSLKILTSPTGKKTKRQVSKKLKRKKQIFPGLVDRTPLKYKSWKRN